MLDDTEAHEANAEKLQDFVGTLVTEVQRRVSRRAGVEGRWLDDLRQVNGQYSQTELKAMREAAGSEVFLNVTRPRTNSFISRVWDFLFPTDDRNWAIQPTPVPELDKEREEVLGQLDAATEAIDQAVEAFEELRDNQPEETDEEAQGKLQEAKKGAADAIDQQDELKAAADDLQEQVEKARKQAMLMQEEIDDCFVEGRYQAQCRDAIIDAATIGTGILKGPVIGEKMDSTWVVSETEAEDGTITTERELKQVPSEKPAVYRVDPWSFYPDPDARRVEDSEGFFELHLMRKGDMRRLAKRSDIDKDIVRELLAANPDSGSATGYLAQLHSINQQQGAPDTSKYYQVWEYRGPVDAEALETIAQAMSDDTLVEDAGTVDPLDEVQATVWFCQGRLLSFSLNPLDSGEGIYSAFSVEYDEAGPWGYGIPYLMRDPQAIINGAARMMMDNAAYSVGPQIVVNKDAIRPDDGKWDLRSSKVWLRNNIDGDGKAAFEVFHIDGHQAELANIIEMGRMWVDDVTSMNKAEQGDGGTGPQQTAFATAMIFNAANITFKRVIKNFDDDITVPIIGRMYQYHMQFSDKEEIKGDYKIEALGSSSLVVREILGQNLMALADKFGEHPRFGLMLKDTDLMRSIVRSLQVPSDELLKTDREYQQALAEQAEQVDPVAQAQMARVEIDREKLDVARDEMTAKTEMSNMEWDARRYIADIQHDAAMNKVAEAFNIKRDELDDKIEMHREAQSSKERVVAVEAALARELGSGGGGHI